MPTSIFTPEQMNSIDYMPAPTGSAVPDIFNLGLYYLGGSKNFQRRPLLDFNVYGAAYSGRPLTAADIIQSADLILYPDSVVGGSGYDCTIERNTRTDWIESEARWDRYRVGNNWTTPGGDVDGADPVPVTFTSPTTTLYDMEITGMLEFVTDAIASRGGMVRARLRKTDEGVVTSHFFSTPASAALGPRLRVAYATAEPRPMMVQSSEGQGDPGALVAQPARPSQPAAPARPMR